MPLDPQFAESLGPHRGCPIGHRRGRDGRFVGKMTRIYYASRETLRWVPVGLFCLDCGAVEIPDRPGRERPERPPPR
uniref:Uncharacterized protein n=1 Tax=viral metagenome TaxID=1070528 RepID=A0A6M3LQN7_9ZZZZ